VPAALLETTAPSGKGFVPSGLWLYCLGMSEGLSVSAPVFARDGELAALYRRAFAEFRSRALWNVRQFDEPDVEQALSVARHLRIEGNMEARRLAELIENAARAVV